jgi:eukaryotic-like serine/threonine-protein kinase
MARADQGLACAPPPELRIALLGMRCAASTSGMKMITATMPDAEELLRSAPPGSVPWAQAMNVYLEGTLLAGRIPDLLAAIARLREVEPAPDAVERMTLALLNGVCMLDALGQVPDASALEERLDVVVRAVGDRELIARFWRSVAIGMRAAYAREDPWSGLQHSDSIRAIFDAIGGELTFRNMQLFRGMNLWYLGARELAEQTLAGIEAADESLGPASSLRRFHLAWLYADRGALEEGRALAAQLGEYGRTHRFPLEEFRGRWVLAEVLRRMGDHEAAEREIELALGMAVPLERPGVLATLAALRLAQGRPAEALVAAEDALARCTAMGGCGMFRGAFVRLAHAEALHATGALEAARGAIAEARARLHAIADRIAEPAYRQSFFERVPENARTLALARAWLGEPTPSPTT